MTRRFSLLVDDRPETLLRVTGLCLRRPRSRRATHGPGGTVVGLRRACVPRP